MRRRLLLSMTTIAAVAIVVFGLPLAFAAGRIDRSRIVSRLQQQATRAAGALPSDGLASGEKIQLPAAPDGIALALYDTHGRRVVGSGPALGMTEVRSALAGKVDDDHDGRWLAVAVPLQDERQIVGAARAAAPWSTVADAALRAWLLVAAVGVAALTLATAIAFRQAARLAAPVEDVARLAVRLGEGDFGARAEPSGVAELDRALTALNHTADRLGELIGRERAFTADVAHQLNTPLTSLRLGLEGALVTPGANLEGTVRGAVDEVDRLQRTVETLLSVARDTSVGTGSCSIIDAFADLEGRWRRLLAGQGRALHLSAPGDPPKVRMPFEVLREILAVLVDNAVIHGAGTVTVAARAAGGGVVVDVADEGTGRIDNVERIFHRRSATAAGHGIGLALARSLAEAHGARLRVSDPGPHPVFSLAVVAAPS